MNIFTAYKEVRGMILDIRRSPDSQFLELTS